MTRFSVIVSSAILFVIASSPLHAASQQEINEAIATLQSASQGLVESYNDNDVKQMLKDEGYGSVKIIEEGKIRFKADGQIYVIYLHEDGDMHVYFGSSGLELNYKDMNEWNRTTRLSRAYLDDDNDIALETDLLANAGINRDMVLQMVKVFVQTSAPRFIEFAQENDKS
ncbi:YbjN domain-containing protein [Amphritea sp. HPY]|uniref:YbjN domain-containing protein n=1 Tax=Amphritea sp. HPY TaxID=3421652 RepID=UPI003D7CDDE4